MLCCDMIVVFYSKVFFKIFPKSSNTLRLNFIVVIICNIKLIGGKINLMIINCFA